MSAKKAGGGRPFAMSNQRRVREETQATTRPLEGLAAAVILQALKDAHQAPQRISGTDRAQAIAFLDSKAPLDFYADMIDADAEMIRSHWRGAKANVMAIRSRR